MGPAKVSTDSASTFKVISFPKLANDGSSWTTYQDCIVNAIKVKGLCCHLLETACKLDDLTKWDSKFYKKDSMTLLSDDDLEKHEDTIDFYEQQEASLWEIIYVLWNGLLLLSFITIIFSFYFSLSYLLILSKHALI